MSSGPNFKKIVFENYPLFIIAIATAYLFLSIMATGKIVESSDIDPGLQAIEMASIVCFFAVVWFFIAGVAVKAAKYADLTKPSPESRGFYFLSYSSTVTLISLVSTTFLDIIRVMSTSPRVYNFLTVLITYITGWLSVIGFYFIFRTGEVFAERVHRQASHSKVFRSIFALAGIIVSFIYLYILSEANSRELDKTAAHLPVWIFSLTIFLPVMIGWALGFVGIYGIYLRHKYSKYVDTKAAMGLIAVGTFGLVLVSILRQTGNYILGSPSQATLLSDFGRFIFFIVGVTICLLFVHSGLNHLLKPSAVFNLTSNKNRPNGN